MDTQFNNFITILKSEVVPALGCTEPTAIAYAAAKAREILGEMPEKIELSLSGNILKNAMSVGIPGTGMTGVDIATAMGVLSGDASKKLEVLEGISQEKINEAKILVKTNFISKTISSAPNKLYIGVKAIKGNNYSFVEIKDFHTAITLIEKNSEVLFRAQCDETSAVTSAKSQVDKSFITIKSIFDFAENVNLNELKFLEQVIELNGDIALEGLHKDYGLKVGKTRLKSVQQGILSDNIETHAIAMTAAASDARMAGSTMAVMTNSGSGNQGITATVPVIAAAQKLSSSHEQLLRAIALSSLVAIHMKNHLGRLSALCGCVVATTGSSCGISYLMGGKYPEMVGTIKNILGNITGMFCDGAKPGCALKIATGVSAGIQGVLLARDGIIISSDDGIIEEDIEKTIKNACAIGRDGMNETDKMILDIMINKNHA